MNSTFYLNSFVGSELRPIWFLFIFGDNSRIYSPIYHVELPGEGGGSENSAISEPDQPLTEWSVSHSASKNRGRNFILFDRISNFFSQIHDVKSDPDPDLHFSQVSIQDPQHLRFLWCRCIVCLKTLY